MTVYYNKRALFGNAFALALVYIINYLFPLLSWPILAKYIGIDAFGALMLVFSIYGLTNIITDFGFNFSATYTISRNQKNQHLINQLLGNIFFIKLLLGLFAVAVALPYIRWKINHEEMDITTLAIIGCTIMFQSFQCVWLFQGIEKMGYITFANLFSKAVYLGLVMFALPFSPNLKTALFYFLANHILLFAMYFFFLRKEGFCLCKPKPRKIVQEIRYGFSFFLARLSVSVYTSVNILVIGFFNGVTAASFYGAAEKMYSVGPAIANSLSQALYPHVAKTGNLRLLVRVVLMMSLPFLAFCALAFVFSEEIIVFTFGKAFLPAVDYLRLFLILEYIVFLSISFGYPGFASFRKIKTVNYITMTGAAFHIAGLCVLSGLQIIQPDNVIYLNLFSETLVLLLFVLFLARYYRKWLRYTEKVLNYRLLECGCTDCVARCQAYQTALWRPPCVKRKRENDKLSV